jgi:hypothetical protein
LSLELIESTMSNPTLRQLTEQVIEEFESVYGVEHMAAITASLNPVLCSQMILETICIFYPMFGIKEIAIMCHDILLKANTLQAASEVKH